LGKSYGHVNEKRLHHPIVPKAILKPVKATVFDPSVARAEREPYDSFIRRFEGWPTGTITEETWSVRKPMRAFLHGLLFDMCWRREIQPRTAIDTLRRLVSWKSRSDGFCGDGPCNLDMRARNSGIAPKSQVREKLLASPKRVARESPKAALHAEITLTPKSWKA